MRGWRSTAGRRRDRRRQMRVARVMGFASLDPSYALLARRCAEALEPHRLLQCLVYACLPTRTARLEMLDYLARKAERDSDLGGRLLRPAPTFQQHRERLCERLRAPKI